MNKRDFEITTTNIYICIYNTYINNINVFLLNEVNYIMTKIIHLLIIFKHRVLAID